MKEWVARLARQGLEWSGRGHLVPFVEGLMHLGRPSTVSFPPELLEQGALVALSGVSNTLAVQSNPDWAWPLWVVRQTDPEAEEFVPTGLNVFTTNLTRRNWTSIGVPGSRHEAMVDPAGVLTPGPFSWSVLPWLRDASGRTILPTMRWPRLRQELAGTGWTAVRTVVPLDGGGEWSWTWEALELDGIEGALLSMRVDPADHASRPGLSLGISLRPWNPLALGHINRLSYRERIWKVNGRPAVSLLSDPASRKVSDRGHGDPLVDPRAGLSIDRLRSRSGIATAECGTGLAPERAVDREDFSVFLPLDRVPSRALRTLGLRDVRHARERMEALWRRESGLGARLTVPDRRLQEALDAVRARLHVFDDGDRFTPGTFLYHEHWFRDSAFLSLAFENLGLGDRVVPKLEGMPSRQRRDGFLVSQTGEWDSNGQGLRMLALHVRRGGDPALADRLWDCVLKACGWIDRTRRLSEDVQGPHRGLLPAGFSAEHFGPNDHYFWDNFWSLAGLEDAAWLARLLGRERDAEKLGRWAGDCRADLAAATAWARDRAGGGLPCSPYRTLDAAAVGNLVAISPLGVVRADEDWVGPTIEFLWSRCQRGGLFFQSIVHTGLNPYLSVQLARVLQERGDPRAWTVLQALLDAATPTWCWPEAIHPRTGGGCMGDGDHGWSACEMVSLVRQFLVREERGGLVLGEGLPHGWFRPGGGYRAEGLPTAHGRLDIEVEPIEPGRTAVRWSLARSAHQPRAGFLELRASGVRPLPLDGERGEAILDLDCIEENPSKEKNR